MQEQGLRSRLDSLLEDESEESGQDDSTASVVQERVDFRTELETALNFGLGLTDPLKHRLQYGTHQAN